MNIKQGKAHEAHEAHGRNEMNINYAKYDSNFNFKSTGLTDSEMSFGFALYVKDRWGVKVESFACEDGILFVRWERKNGRACYEGFSSVEAFVTGCIFFKQYGTSNNAKS